MTPALFCEPTHQCVGSQNRTLGAQVGATRADGNTAVHEDGDFLRGTDAASPPPGGDDPVTSQEHR